MLPAQCVGVLLGSLGGFYMALTIPPSHFAYAGGLSALSTVWLLTRSMAVIAIRNRQFELAREYVTRPQNGPSILVVARSDAAQTDSRDLPIGSPSIRARQHVLLKGELRRVVRC